MTPTQVQNGKAFEYALLMQFKEKLSLFTEVKVQEDDFFQTARNCFELQNQNKQKHLLLTSSFAVNFLMDIEPRLKNALNNKDILLLRLNSDAVGQTGDVRDVLTIRSEQKWEIGISAKHNHRALKHSRLSAKLDFGKKWLGIPCSQQYFDDIKPIFDELSAKRQGSNQTAQWKTSFENISLSVYKPILTAFKTELERLHSDNPKLVSQRLLEYLVGTKDFYKVISNKNIVEIEAYNLHGSLSEPFIPSEKNKNRIASKYTIPKLKLPNQILSIDWVAQTTLMVAMNNGWQISFRIHNASSRVEASLKFDIQLVSSPRSLFTNKLTLP